MKRRKFMIAGLAAFPLAALANIHTNFLSIINKGFKTAAGEARFGKRFSKAGGTLNVLELKISGADTNGGIAVFEQTGLTYKGGPALHTHLLQDEWFYVLEGEYFFQVGEDKFQMKAGDTIFLPRNVPHAFVQLTERAKMTVSYMPAGKIEGFFETTNNFTSKPSMEELAKIFADHDMKLVGPPLKI
jgi:quercetin dioxygenase-like cupin family protein